MESPDAETGVGTIVWVRRRNGSWWPGKILGPVELSASHLMSPRSGTPVKLLGREDASVDWYNLEKSKRVKPFRCGEFDDCIERAEASQGVPPKKREKYARREDAILHALELEKQLLEKKYGKPSVESNAMLMLGEDSSFDNGSGLLLFTSQVNVDDKTRPSSRLQEPKYCLSSLADSNGSYKHDDGLTTERCKNVLEKRKRLQQEEETLSNKSRRDRRRPLVQVLKSSAKLYPLQSYAADGGEQTDTAVHRFEYTQSIPDQPESPIGLNEENDTTGSNEDTETDSSGTESLISDTYDSMAALLDEGENIEFIPKAAFEGQGEASTSDDSIPIQKWQLKGKRNTRSSSRYTFPMKASWMKDEIHVHVKEHPEPSVHVGRMLIDVEVGVQSGYQREHVPMISLMSKLNDQAIVGHPIPVETLVGGSSDFIQFSPPSPDHEESCLDSTLELWRTAKCRQPLEEYLVDDSNKKNHKSKKLVKSRTSSCNKKIRTLSSIGGNHRVMKREPLTTAVACIPVKLVFSRLHEELVARHQ